MCMCVCVYVTERLWVCATEEGSKRLVGEGRV